MAWLLQCSLTSPLNLLGAANDALPSAALFRIGEWSLRCQQLKYLCRSASAGVTLSPGMSPKALCIYDYRENMPGRDTSSQLELSMHSIMYYS